MNIQTFSPLVRRRSLLAIAFAVLLSALYLADVPNAYGTAMVVDTTSDASLTACTGAAGDCSLRGAMTNANANGGADTITFDPSVFPSVSSNSITSPATSGNVGEYASSVLDASGYPVISYFDHTGFFLRVMHCNDINCSGGDESIGTPDACCVGSNTSLALDASGFPVVSYMDESTFDLKILHCNDVNCVGGGDSINAVDTGASAVGYYSSLRLDGSGFPVVSYWDTAPGDDLKVLHCNDANCAAGGDSITAPDTGGSVGSSTSLALDGSGFPVISYYDITGGNLKVMHCNDVNCAGGGENINAPDTTGLVGTFTSLRLDGSGFPVVSYYDITNGNLKLMHCNDVNCAGSNETINSPDTAGDVGQYTHLSLDGSGFPVVSYYDNTNGNLKVMHCNDVNCAGSNDTINSADTVGVVGQYTGLNLDGTGRPVVSYYDVSNQDLKVLHCGDANCGPVTITLGSALPTLTAGSDTISGAGTVAVDGVTGAFNCFTISGEASDFNTINGLQITRCATGIRIDGGADSNIVGGTTVGERNVISGNTDQGVLITGGSVNGNVVKGNYIGTNAAGTAASANGSTGVLIDSGATGNTVGGTTAGERNVISGNGNWGVGITGATTAGNRVQGNYIGTNVAGTAAIANITGVALWAPSNTVGGSAAAANVISGNPFAGVEINAAGDGNVVSSNYIGLGADGSTIVANGMGISLSNGASSNNIGGLTSAERNVISGNGNTGIKLDATANNSNNIRGNYIGTNAAGTAAKANALSGIIVSGGTGNTIGGTTVGERNIISGNSGSGVTISGTGATGNVVEGNYIGTDASGTVGLGAQGRGVSIAGSPSNLIGGPVTVPGQPPGNVISGNGTGIEILGSASTFNDIWGNIIGANATGTVAVPNVTGMNLNGAQFTQVGIAGVTYRNIISGNTGSGIAFNGSPTTDNSVQGNYIGTQIDGISPLGNGNSGVNIYQSHDNTIGSTDTGAGNIIANNTGDGVRIDAASATANTIRANNIYNNSEEGIDLGADGPTANDAGDGDSGPNNLQNFPVITSSSSDGGSTTISGTLDTPSPDTASVDVFSTQSGDPEGRVYLGSATPSVGGVWTLLIMGTPAYGRLTATATKGGSTSEFSSPDVAAPLGPGLPLTTVVRQGDTTPLTPTAGTFASFGPAVIPNTSGDVVFWASVTGGSAPEAIFKNSGGTITKLVASGDPAPVSVGGTFATLTPSPHMNDSGDIVFWASVTGGSASSGLFLRTAGGVITKIAAVGDTSPAGGQTYTNFTLVAPLSFPINNAGGDVTFFANLSGGGNGIFLYTGTIAKVVATGDAAPTGGTFTDLKGIGGFTGVPVVSDLGQVSFWGSTSLGPTGVFLWKTGTISKIAATGDTVPGGGTTYSTFGGIPIVNSSGDVVFVSTTVSGKTGVYVKPAVSATARLFQSGDPAPAGIPGTITSPGYPTINGTGQVTVYVGFTDSVTSGGIVRYTGGVLENVAAVGNIATTTPSTVTFSSFTGVYGTTIPTINNYGQVATWGALSTGTNPSGIFITSAPTSSDDVHLGPIEGAHVPGAGNGTFGNTFDLGLNGNNQAVFTDTIANGTSTQGVFMFFAGNPTEPVQTLALQGGTWVGAPTTDEFKTFGPPLNNDGSAVGVRATLNTQTYGSVDDQGLYLFFAGNAPPPPQRRARTSGSDFANGTFATFGNPSINADGNLAATATLTLPLGTPDTGLYMFFAGQPRQLAKSGLPDGTYNYSSFGSPSVNSCVSICPAGPIGSSTSGAYVAARSVVNHQTNPGFDDQALYLFFAGNPIDPPDPTPMNVIARTGQVCCAADGYSNTFTAPANGGFSDPVINSQNGVVFTADTTDTATHTTTGKGLFLFFAGSPITKLADLGTSSGGFGTFQSFSNPVLGDTSSTGTTVVAHATLSGGGEGLFLFFAGQPVKKIAVPGGSPAENEDIHFSGDYPVFPYVAMNGKASVVFVSKITGGPAGSTQGVFFSTLDHDADGVRDAQDDCPNTPNTPQANADGDSAGDQCDNCPAWPNSTQALPTWPVPAGDSDCDGFPDSVAAGLPNPRSSETHVGTDATKHCSTDSTRNNEGPPDAWPVDFDDNQRVNGSDFLTFAPVYGKSLGNPGYDAHWDLNNDNKINGTDFLKMSPFFGKICAQQLTVNVVCSPTTDPGKFNLQIDGVTAGTGANAACVGGTTGIVNVSIGAHTVSETAGSGTDLANYTTVIGGNCTSTGAVTMAVGDAKTCTITNTRH